MEQAILENSYFIDQNNMAQGRSIKTCANSGQKAGLKLITLQIFTMA